MRRSTDDDTEVATQLDESDLELLDGPGHLRRPRPSGAWLRDWVRWFGPVRLIACVFAVIGVAFAGWWLVRTPPEPTEAALPIASTASSAPAGTPGAPATPPATSTPPASTEPSEVVVHVTGAVHEPGVYQLPPGSRVHDAVLQAGGFTRRADTSALNLAAAVGDGSQVYVPAPGEEIPAAVTPVPAPGAPADSSASGDGEVGEAGEAGDAPVNVNTADQSQLETLPGIGPVTAEAIIEHRESAGGFTTVDELEDVRGIGPATLDTIYDLVTV